MNLKRWMLALVAVLLVACGNPTVQPVARVDNVILSRQELDQRIDRIEKGMQGQEGQTGLPSRLEIERQLVGLFIDQNLVLSVARQRGVTIDDREVDARIESIRADVARSGGDLNEAVQTRLGLSGADAPEFRQFVLFIAAREKLGETLVPTDTVRQQVTDEVMAEANRTVEQATTAHILVETEEEAKQVIERLNKGEKFEDLAKELSKDPGSAQNGGVYEGVQRGQFVPEFDKAIFEDLQPGETTQTPVQTQFGFHVIKLIERGQGPAMTQDQATQVIEQNIGQQLATRRQQAVQELIDQERTKAKAEGRLEEPIYPEPTPDPALAPEQPDQQSLPTTVPADQQEQPTAESAP